MKTTPLSVKTFLSEKEHWKRNPEKTIYTATDRASGQQTQYSKGALQRIDKRMFKALSYLLDNGVSDADEYRTRASTRLRASARLWADSQPMMLYCLDNYEVYLSELLEITYSTKKEGSFYLEYIGLSAENVKGIHVATETEYQDTMYMPFAYVEETFPGKLAGLKAAVDLGAPVAQIEAYLRSPHDVALDVVLPGSDMCT